MRIPKFPMPHTAVNGAIMFGAAIAGGFIGLKYFKGNKQTIPTVMSGNARAYAADSNADNIASRLTAIIVNSALSPAQAYSNMDRIVAAVSQQKTRLENLANERKQGSITPTEFRAKLKEIAREVATSLGLSLQAGDVNIGWGVQTGLWKGMKRYSTANYGRLRRH